MITSLNELKNLSEKELIKELEKARKEVLRYKIGIRMKQMKDSHTLKKNKKYVAQIMTILSESKKEKVLAEKKTSDTISRVH
ncbi:50S ribosomal protein L29 [Candidatus Peregrinibacteria bacterium]|nr:50S ribosomal protein L29 [Candidatus Peregrinibacteria bacterium]